MTESRKPAGRGADPPDDRSLVRAAQGGDAQAFRGLVERYQRRVYQLALGRVKDADEAMDITQEALAGLSENHRAILLLREVEGLSYEELARTLGIRKGTVMSRLFHARLKMQRKLREYLADEVKDEGEGEG